MLTQIMHREAIKPLSQLEAGQTGWIISLEVRNIESRRELASLGVLPHAMITVFANHRSNIIFNVNVNDKQVAADKETAAEIMVQIKRN